MVGGSSGGGDWATRTGYTDKAEQIGSPFDDCPLASFHTGFPLAVTPIAYAS